MSATIQEADMIMTVKYCQKFNLEIDNVLLQYQNKQKLVSDKILTKINSEKKDVDALRETKDKCERFISENNEAERSNLNTISDLKNINYSYMETISNTPTEVYSSVWSEYRGGFVNQYDYEASAHNQRLIRNMQDSVDFNNSRIDSLHQRNSKCRDNVRALKNMQDNVKNRIEEKNKYIRLLEQDKKTLENKLNDFKKQLLMLKEKLEELRSKVNDCANFFQAYGKAISKIGYKDNTIGYSEMQAIVTSAEAMQTERETLNCIINTNRENLASIAKAALKYKDLLDDELSRSVAEMIRTKASLFVKINTKYEEFVKYLKQAQDYIAEYEKIQIIR